MIGTPRRVPDGPDFIAGTPTARISQSETLPLTNGEDRVSGAKSIRLFPRWAVWLGVSLVIVGTALALEVRPNGRVAVSAIGWTLPELCWSRITLGMDCPGCGITRSFVFSAHGQWDEAWNIHAIGTVGFVIVLLQIPLRIMEGFLYWRRSGMPDPSS